MARYGHLEFSNLLDLLSLYTDEYTKAFKERKVKSEMESLHKVINEILEEIETRKKNGET